MFFEIIFWILVLFLSLTFIRTLMGPKLWDRLLGLNLITIKATLIIVVYSAIQDSSLFVDIAIIYALLSFIGTVFLALFLAERKRKEKK